MSRVVVVSGGNKGIGLEIVRGLCKHDGLQVVIAARSLERAGEAIETLRGEFPNAKLEALPLDLDDEASVDAFAANFAEKFGRLDVLINNAAVMFNSSSGVPFEKQAAATLVPNLFNTLRLTEGLLPLLGKTEGSRVVNVASQIANTAFDGSSAAVQARWRAATSLDQIRGLAQEYLDAVQSGTTNDAGFAANNYGTSKLALVAATRVLAAGNPSIVFAACCPGWCRTDMGSSAAPRSAEQGADTPVYLALEADASVSGGFFSDRKPKALL